MKIEDVLVPKNIGKRFKFNLNGQEVITEVKGYYTCGYQKIVLDFIDEIDFEEVEREIDWCKVDEYSKVQVRNENSDEWENKYFLQKVEQDGKIGFIATTNKPDDFTNSKCGVFMCYKQCRIHSSQDIKEEWYKEYKEEK